MSSEFCSSTVVISSHCCDYLSPEKGFIFENNYCRSLRASSLAAGVRAGEERGRLHGWNHNCPPLLFVFEKSRP